MNQFTATDVVDAYARIANLIYQTPLEEALYLGDGSRKYYFKLECQQRKVKAFKLRGALNKMATLTDEEKSKGVATISSGNHGAAVSYGASLMNIEKAVIVVPENCPQSKVDKIRRYGGQVVKLGQNYDEAHHLGLQYIENQQMTYVDSYDKDPLVYAGQGTVALEILKQNREIDTIVAPVGGGSLITGTAVIAKSINPDIRIIGVQTEACPAMIRSIEDKCCYREYPMLEESVCDCLVGGVGELAYAMLPQHLSGMISVSEESIRRAAKYMMTREKIIVEGGSATVAAAVMEHPEEVGGKNVALIMSGGNIDEDLMIKLLCEA